MEILKKYLLNSYKQLTKSVTYITQFKANE